MQEERPRRIAEVQEEVLRVAREVLPSDSTLLVPHLFSQSSVYYAYGQVGQAMATLHEAIEIVRRVYGDEHPYLPSGLANLGSIYSTSGRHAEATEFFEQASALAMTIYAVDDVRFGELKLLHGMHLMRIGQRREARPLLEESLRILRSHGSGAGPNALKAYERLTDACRADGDREGADAYLALQRKAVLAEHGNDSMLYVDVLLSEARHLYMRRKYGEALRKCRAAAALTKRFNGEHSRRHVPVLDSLIQISLALGDMPSVVKYYEQLLDLEIYWRESLFDVYSERQQIDRVQQELHSLDGLLILALEGHIHPRRAYHRALAYKGAVACRQRSVRDGLQSAASRRLIAELSRIDAELAGSMDASQRKLTHDRRNSLSRRRREIIAELNPPNAVRRTPHTGNSVGELRQLLPTGSVVVDYFEYVKPPGFLDRLFGRVPALGLVAFVMSADGNVQLIDLGSIKPAFEALIAWRSAMSVETYAKAKSGALDRAELTDQRGAALRKIVWDPLRMHAKGAKTVVVSPSLHLIGCPFAALPSRDDDSYLIERFAFAQVAAPRMLADLLVEREDVGEPVLLLVGDIDYGAAATPAALGDPIRPFAPLPGA
ncbi:MAG: tetratricopeptide repeat protein, partial [Planctomycetota bacterium]